MDKEKNTGIARMTVEDIAKICHQVTKGYCKAFGELHKNWDDAPGGQRNSWVKGVEFHLKNPDASASASHAAWLAHKEKDGWCYGAVKNESLRTHPCCLPFEKLTYFDQAKDHIFRAIVDSLKIFLNEGGENKGE